MRRIERIAFVIVSVSLAAAFLPRAQAGHCHHCRKCVVCCQQAPHPAEREAVEDRPRAAQRSVVQAPIVQSMPVYTMPMMYAAMPVVPAMATAPTRAAEYRVPGDCCERVDKLEQQMKELARSMSELQTIVHGQTEVLKVLANRSMAPAPAPQQ